MPKQQQNSLIWGMLRSTQLSRVSSAYASRGLEPCSVRGGHVGHAEPVVQPAPHELEGGYACEAHHIVGYGGGAVGGDARPCGGGLGQEHRSAGEIGRAHV